MAAVVNFIVSDVTTIQCGIDQASAEESPSMHEETMSTYTPAE